MKENQEGNVNFVCHHPNLLVQSYSMLYIVYICAYIYIFILSIYLAVYLYKNLAQDTWVYLNYLV